MTKNNISCAALDNGKLSSGKNVVYNSDVSIHGSNPFIASRHQQFTPDQLLDSKNNTILTPYSDSSSAILNSFGSIFYLQMNNFKGQRKAPTHPASLIREINELES